MGTSASTSAPPGAQDWVLLDRAARLAGFRHAGVGVGSDDADVRVDLQRLPGVSTATVDRALLPDDCDDTPWCRVEGADASGRLLLALNAPRAPAEAHLLVCRPIASSSSGAAEGKARALPASPEALGVAISPTAPTGIVAAKGGDAFFVAQVHKAPASTPSSPVVVRAICYSSEDEAWAVRDVRAEDRWRDFAATRAVFHDRGVPGDGVRLVFVDPGRGLLLLHPREAASSQFVDLPEAVGGGRVQDASVDSSGGKLVCVLFYDKPNELYDGPEGLSTMVGLWSLSEEDLRWHRHLHPASDLYHDEVFCCDDRLPRGRVRGIGPIDPDRLTRLFFVVDSSSFAVDVKREAMVMGRASLVDYIQPIRACDASESTLVCLLRYDPRTWSQKFDQIKEAGKVAMEFAQRSRKHIPKIAPAFQLVGDTFNLPLTASVVTIANVIDKVNTCVGLAESTSSLVRQIGPAAPPPVWQQYDPVGTREEALRAIRAWEQLGKPAEMKVSPAPGVTRPQLVVLRQEFIDAGAEDLMLRFDDDEFVMVQTAPMWF